MASHIYSLRKKKEEKKRKKKSHFILLQYMDWILKVDICQADTFYSTVAGTFLYYHPIFKKTKLFLSKK
jgi:hypothetical protein